MTDWKPRATSETPVVRMLAICSRAVYFMPTGLKFHKGEPGSDWQTLEPGIYVNVGDGRTDDELRALFV